MFTTDIIREIDTYLELDFMDVSSYGEGTESSGEVKIIKDLDTSVTGRDVLIVEDIIDTGRTLQRLVELFKHRNAKSVKICTLLDKPERRVEGVKPDYVGFILVKLIVNNSQNLLIMLLYSQWSAYLMVISDSLILGYGGTL